MSKKSIVVLAFGSALLTGALSQTAQAQYALLTPGGAPDTGTSFLSDALGSGMGSPESLTISWSVSESLLDVYTYSYTVVNPALDIQLPGSASPGSSEIVDAFSVGFNTMAPGAYVPNSQVGGTFDQNNGVAGLAWAFPAIAAGSSSPVPLVFSSLLAPVPGNANASDDNPPSPWASSPTGQQVPVPGVVPEPATTALFVLTALLLLPFRSTILRFVRQGA